MKKVISLILCLSLILSFTLPAMADESFISELEEIGEENYYKYTISFEYDTRAESQSNISELTNVEKINQAIEYVESLNLEEQGYGYIEDSCLMQLEELKEENCNLAAYTVCVPQNSADEPEYLGTRSGITFYYGKYAEISEVREDPNQKITETDVLQSWVQGIFDFVLCIVDVPVSIAATILALTIGGIPIDEYEVVQGDMIQWYFRINGDCYGVYVKSGGEYQMLVSCEDGYYIPYVAFHHRYGISDKTFESVEVSTPSFGDTDTLLTVAWAIYSDTAGVVHYERLRYLTAIYEWE